MELDPSKLKSVLVTDCGSTTTKALLFEKTELGWRKTFRGESPTTVEEPVSDVTVGVFNSFIEIEEVSKRKILTGNNFISSNQSDTGVDLYLSTSSAGGGLQMIVSGIVDKISAESAQRAALGAGAIVLETLSAEQLLDEYAVIEKIRHLRPDIFLMAGGFDGGAKNQLIELAELLLAASPKPRFGNTLRLPIIFAGNQDVKDDIATIFGEQAQLKYVANLRPKIELENIKPARDVIHEFFLEHVMSHSPGYDKLLKMSPYPILPTPAAVGDLILSYSEQSQQQILCVDIGGATTDVFSTIKDSTGKLIFNRTVSANLGMSYSIANVVIEAGLDRILQWLPITLDRDLARNSLKNKMIRPISIPQTKVELFLEQAVCREALRLSLEHHRSLAVGISKSSKNKGISSIFKQTNSRQDLLDLLKIDLVIGSGGVLSHAPNRLAAALMMIDGFNLKGWTEIAVDSVFMMPHLGILSKIHPAAANEIFIKDCLIKVCHVLSPVVKSNFKGNLAEIEIDQKKFTIKVGDFIYITLPKNKDFQIIAKPISNKVNLGAGFGEILDHKFVAGEQGVIIDARLNNYDNKFSHTTLGLL